VLQFICDLATKRISKTKIVERWARKVVSDVLLCQAAREIEQELFEADLVEGCAKSECPFLAKEKVGQRVP
jgi:hypothetical protein